MKLVVLGSGTAVPHAKRASAAFWLETENASLLLDISAAAIHRMAQEQLDWSNLDAIWISHFHLDHLGGLTPFLFGTKWAPATQERRKPLRIYGPQGLKRLVATIDESNHYQLFDQTFPIEIIEVAPHAEFEILPRIMAHTFSTPHTKESMAISITDNRKTSLVYSSDTGYSQDFIEFAKDATLLLLECSFRKHKPVQTHLELSEAMRLAEACRPHKLVLTHLYPEWDGCNVAAEAKALWSGEVIEATDGLRLEV